MKRLLNITAATLLVLLGAGAAPAEARYKYGSYSAGGGGESGFILFLEGMSVNPRNTDTVVATSALLQDYAGGVNTVSQIVPGWEDEFTGRIGFGYEWASGSKIIGSVWGFTTEQQARGDGPVGGELYYAIGPPIYTGGDYVGTTGSPGHYDLLSTIEAGLGDVAYVRDHQLSEAFKLQWTAGLRYATFEETTEGFYDNAAANDLTFGLVRYSASKNNKGEMIGARVGVRGTFNVTESFWFSSGLAFSLLDGEVTGTSMLSPTGLTNSATEPSAFSGITESGRSGSILDFDLVGGWSLSGDAIRVWIGWEQSVWDGIASDLVRNFPGTVAPLRDRDSVVFSGYKLGVGFRF
jgi:hypothetical protein